MNKIILTTIMFFTAVGYSFARPPFRGPVYPHYHDYPSYYNGYGLRPGFQYNPRSGWYRQGYFNSRFGYVPVVPAPYVVYPPYDGAYFNPYWNPNWSEGW